MDSPQIGPPSMHSDVAVVIPAYNEELTIGTVVLRSKVYASEVIVVDDGSSDHTSEVASMAGAKVITLPENHGKAYAVYRGFAEVMEKKYSAVVMLDADGQHDPSDITKVIKPIMDGQADLVIGSRLLENGHQIPLYRKFGQKVLNQMTDVGSDQKVTDSQSGFRAMNMKGVENMNFRSDGYGLESAMILHFASKGLVIKEVPIGVRYDVPHKHKKNPISMGFGLVNQLITQLGRKKPMKFLTAPGLSCSMVGVFLVYTTASGNNLFGWEWIVEILFSGLFLFLGSVLVASGLALNSVRHMGVEKSLSNLDPLGGDQHVEEAN